MDIFQTTDRTEQQAQTMQRYYRLHSKIYDATRWSFLFGRKRIIRQLPDLVADPAPHILEVGCGTGYNLKHLALRFPNARLTGMDVSGEMLQRAARRILPWRDRISLLEQPYGEENSGFNQKFDLILFSYSLTMINPHWATLIARAKQDLKPGGIIAVVDFHDSPFSWFKRHMANNHVRMDGHLRPALEAEFLVEEAKICRAYAGIWAYLLFWGRVEVV
ncbi:MAG: methyltransferase domain-containing protein [Saprospiraceae bacterium]|nr:methyltransferase domain-containing protein [Saprospiraceae bacterium]